MRVWYLFPIVAALVVACLAATTSATPDTVNLKAGSNAVTWSGAEPYAISSFEGTPVSQIHRFDAVRQKWLSRTVGQDEATLPELHLLPRVQYLLVADEAYELTIPNPLADIESLAELRFPPLPDDPLRFEAYWPNEDSPLEDLILLRSDDERLSVEAWVEGGVGEIEVYWALDGRLNHQGLASDDVELLPGRHDDPRLYAVDESRQAAVVKLPRVVKLPQIEIPEMVYGVNAWALGGPFPDQGMPPLVAGHYEKPEEWVAQIEMIADVGFEYVRMALWMHSMVHDSSLATAHRIGHLDWLFQTMHDNGLKPLPILGWNVSTWARLGDAQAWTSLGAFRDLRDAEAIGRFAARRWPDIQYFDVSNEPNLNKSRIGLDPQREVRHQKALALGIWYENPSAIIVGGTPCCFWSPNKLTFPAEFHSGFNVLGVNGLVFVEAMYAAGFGPWHDIAGIHLSADLGDVERELVRYREIMTRYGDADKPVWATETPAQWDNEQQYTELLVDHLRFSAEHEGIQGLLIWKMRDFPPDHPHGVPGSGTEYESGIVAWEYRNGKLHLQPSGIAVRDFLRSVVDD